MYSNINMDNFIMKSSLTGDGTIRVHSGSQKEEKAMTKMTKKKNKTKTT